MKKIIKEHEHFEKFMGYKAPEFKSDSGEFHVILYISNNKNEFANSEVQFVNSEKEFANDTKQFANGAKEFANDMKETTKVVKQRKKFVKAKRASISSYSTPKTTTVYD